MAAAKKRVVTSEHKAAMATGRTESAAVKRYLSALDENRPKRGRKRTPDSIKKRLVAIDAELDVADALQRLNLIQERKDLTAELETKASTVDVSALEAEFVKVARAYGERKGITYGTWREVGVSAETLKKAGIARTRG
jgi:uncharacterized protein YicC (UPF0701 family)